MAIEFTEAMIIANQMKKNLLRKKIIDVIIPDIKTKTIQWGFLNLHKIDIKNQKINNIIHNGDHIFLELDNFALKFGEMIGKILFHKENEQYPKNSKAIIILEDNTKISYNPTLYGLAYAFDKKDLKKEIKSTGISPLDEKFTVDYIINCFKEDKRKIVKQMNLYGVKYKIAGIGNGYWTEILYHSGINPKRKKENLNNNDYESMYYSTKEIIQKSIKLNGSIDETDLFGNKGEYIHYPGKRAKNKPCIKCGNLIQAKSILGSTSYFCTKCQKI
ncbi:zinc finger domain-containing protein [Oceanotoga teriensis]|uniref:zinc finger domain-containing protein n=1 Tax=Oceanotoga teriensis TaxID=515440 RepID=UPI0027126489|nr:zinc finger domain-containing protein [Oceanotoga teriensis]MDO7977720.1 hypothetical protein [Oceanotoga teriensis]